MRVQTSILSQYGSVAVPAGDCVSSGATSHDLISAVADAAAPTVGAAKAEQAAADPATATEMSMATPGLYTSSGHVNSSSDTAQSCVSSTVKGKVTALERPASADALASSLRQNLVDWDFNPFTADTPMKCKLIEAMFYTLGVSQVPYIRNSLFACACAVLLLAFIEPFLASSFCFGCRHKLSKVATVRTRNSNRLEQTDTLR
jgi:hypothetical protein